MFLAVTLSVTFQIAALTMFSSSMIRKKNMLFLQSQFKGTVKSFVLSEFELFSSESETFGLLHKYACFKREASRRMFTLVSKK